MIEQQVRECVACGRRVGVIKGDTPPYGRAVFCTCSAEGPQMVPVFDGGNDDV